jgi:hypothetical protein
MPRRYHESEDMDDVMSTIIHGRQKEAVPVQASIPKKERGKSFVNVPLAIVGLLIILAFGILYMRNRSEDVSLIPEDISSKLVFPVYYPSELPGRFSIDSSSDITQPEDAEDVVIIHAQDDMGRTLDISQQALPSAYEFNQYFGEFTEEYFVDTPIGKATVGSSEDMPILASIATDKTLIIITTSRNISKAEFETLLKNLTLDS